MNEDPRFILIGGFLGAGKTTAILKFASWLNRTKGWRVGVITNDQANGLVDTALAEGARFSVREIGGGCFCCHSASLADAIQKFDETLQPHVLIGEPVGSCTDLVATVLDPLQSIYNCRFSLAPLSVVVDPFRAERSLLSNEEGGSGKFSSEVDYIYRKQLEEAKLLVINKCDVLSGTRLNALVDKLNEFCPSAELLRVSARTGAGLEDWWERILVSRHSTKQYMEVDYSVYADGEARLGWINGEYELTPVATGRIDGNRVLETIVSSIKQTFAAQNVEVAHLKIAITSSEMEPNGPSRELAAVQWVRNDAEPEFTLRLTGPMSRGTLLLNLRAEGEPEALTTAVCSALDKARSEALFRRANYSAFKPAPPKPTYRLTSNRAES